MAYPLFVGLYLFGSACVARTDREIIVMGNRYKPIAIVAGLLFLIGAVGGLLGSGAFTSVSGASRTGLTVFILIGLVMCVAAYWWAIRFPIHRVVPDLGLIIAFSCLASILLLPLIENITAKGKWKWGPASPFYGGAGLFFDKIWLYLACTLLGALIGWLISIAVGKDYRTKALKHYTAAATAKPRRVVRR
jgi:predicted acyltransferase